MATHSADRAPDRRPTDPAAPGPAPLASGADTPDARADEAARSVIRTFGHRLLGVPGTHLAARVYPRPPLRDPVWNYWWQAHYLDAIVDAGLRSRRTGRPADARAYLRLGRQLVHTVWLRNLAHFSNDFYDDMAWLILAAGRLDGLATDLDARPPLAGQRILGEIAPRLRGAESNELGGGIYWTTKRDRKNVPATAPSAIHFARAGDPRRGSRLVDWIYATLWDDAQGLALDTVYVDGRRDPTVYSYNQGTVLGALLAVGDPPSLARAADLIRAVDRGLRSSPDRPVLRTYGDGDGGLFTGILVRYLASAATDARLDAAVRGTAADLVAGTAQALWRGSELRELGTLGRVRVFSPDPDRPAADAVPAGESVDFSPQLQAWTVLEADALVAASA